MHLPADLHGARDQCINAITAAMESGSGSRLQVDLCFEGLRCGPFAHGLYSFLQQRWQPLLAFPDMGAAALARRDFGLTASAAVSFGHLDRGDWPQDTTVCVAVAPAASDFDLFTRACTALGERVVIALNPRLEDAAVGIGRVARARRAGFLSSWQVVYGLYPMEHCVLARSYPGPWCVFREDADGFRPVASLPNRPDAATVDALLGGRSMASAVLKGTDGLLKQLGS